MALDNHADRRNGAARWVANISTASTSLQYISAAVISILYYCRYVLGVACDVGMTSAGMGAGSALGCRAKSGASIKAGRSSGREYMTIEYQDIAGEPSAAFCRSACVHPIAAA